MNFTAVRDAVKQADLFRYKGKIEKIIGMTIEASDLSQTSATSAEFTVRMKTARRTIPLSTARL